MPRKPEIARNSCCFSGTIGAKQGHNVSFGHCQRHTLHGSDYTLVDDFDLVDLEKGLAHLRALASGRYLNGHSRK